ncbi:NUMOD4 domain-containing protein [Romboutsia sedimentorum]|uniref:NUMOD4 domain-containing protein n=1 Tax=Romboutsia sedimentorum TaxID=1368474 RepID=A0ABT7EAH7_9FIRM|nr:NUMOD4 domain-containing protein [Romboutsia sedimentorum]MDK2563934.1 NUMOD4 domain-containing protein [Romboutsia sedimentorum]
MENEIWKDVKEYEAVLQVSDLGNARTKDRYVINSNGVKIFRKGINKKAKLTHGYYQIQLNQKGKNICFMLHRLIID